MNYKETTEYLFTAMPSFQNIGGDAYKPGLERIESFCREIGSPERRYPTIHIAGTNGKGSTSSMLASTLRSAGYRVGLFTSPHLRDFRERIRVDGEMISEQQVIDFVAEHKGAMERMSLSFFEMTASMAFDHFARSGVDIAVIECGLGGRLDATNAITPILSIITNIGLDHTQYLGDTLPEIAAEKGGIIKRGVEVVIGERSEETDGVFKDIAQKRSAPITFAEDLYRVINSEVTADYQHITISHNGAEQLYATDLQGEYQRYNVVTLLAAIEAINRHSTSICISTEAVEQGLKQVTRSMHFEGRWHKLQDEPLTICDTAHNTHGIKEMTRQLATCNYNKLYCVLGFARDKSLREILPLFPADAHFIFTRPNIERALTTSEIAQVAESLSLDFEVVESVADAATRAQEIATKGDMIFIGGSNFVIAEII